jgi:mRNA interferase RelE/StbE
MFKVLVSETFQKQYSKFDKKFQKRIKDSLEHLKSDPHAPRPGADIIPIKETNPQKYRLRVGDYRIVYRVEEKTVKVIEIFPRGRGYK